MEFFQILYDSVSKCICSLGGDSSASTVLHGDSIAKKPKGASYSDFSPPKLRTTDLSTQLSSNIEDSHIFASRTTSRYGTPLPSSRYAEQPASPSVAAAVVEEDGNDRTTAEVLAKARLQAMKGTAVRTRRTLGADVAVAVAPPFTDRSHKRRMEIFRPRHVEKQEDDFAQPKRSYHCGASADDAFHLAASIFRVQEDPLSEFSPPLPMLCFAKPIREDTLLDNPINAPHSQDSADSSTTNSSMYHDSLTDLYPSNNNNNNPTRPIPLYDHYLVIVSEEHKDEIARIMKSGTHKSFECMHLDDSSEYMHTGSEDKQELCSNIQTLSIKRLNYDDRMTFDTNSKLLTPVTEESRDTINKDRIEDRIENDISLFRG